MAVPELRVYAPGITRGRGKLTAGVSQSIAPLVQCCATANAGIGRVNIRPQPG